MFETFEHTADVGLRVHADSLNELFAEAAVGFTSLIVSDVDAIELSMQRSLELQSTDREYLYFDWLSELLYLFESTAWLTVKADVEITDNSLKAVLHGGTFDEQRGRPSYEVKAITYHGLSVTSKRDGDKERWTAEVIVDI